MSEYIIEWSGIGARIVELIGSVPTCLIPKRLREERLREEIVRCRDCRWAKPDHSDHEYRGEYRCNMWITDVDAYGFCFRAMRKECGE